MIALALGGFDLAFEDDGTSTLSLFSSGFRLEGFLGAGAGVGSSGCFEVARVRVARVAAGALAGATTFAREDARVGAALLAIVNAGVEGVLGRDGMECGKVQARTNP